MEPLIVADVARIIENIPDSDPTGALDASLFIFSVSTGARAISCTSIRLRDIEAIVPDTSSHSTLITINIPVGKGQPNWNHKVTLEGSFQKTKLLNFIYYLDKHLQNSFHFSLTEFQKLSLPDTVLNSSLWGLSKDSMRHHLKVRAEAAGYPSKMIGFHSLRSGMLCSALLSAGSDPEERRAVFETTAIIAGWIPNSPAQLRYVKQPMARTIICSHVTGIKFSSSSNTTVSIDASNPARFHSFKLSQPSVAVRSYPRIFRTALVKELSSVVSYSSHRMKKKFIRACCSAVIYHFGTEQSSTLSDSQSSSSMNPCLYDVYQQYGYDYIQTTLHEKKKTVMDLVHSAMDYLQKTGRLEKFRIRYNDDQAGLDSAHSSSSSTHKRTRNEWTREEDAFLIQKVGSGCTLQDITRLWPERFGRPRDRSSILQHYKRLQKVSAADGVKLPDPRRQTRVWRQPRQPLKQSQAQTDSDTQPSTAPVNLHSISEFKRHCSSHY